MNTAPKYRPDIDGLRAISVLAVLLFHFGLKPISGGFVGVDVFFVISGFLITGILASQLQAEGRISLSKFYIRRAKRILPMLLTVLLVFVGIGFFILFPDDYAATARSAIYALFGVSNFYFHQNTGYFDQVSSLLPFLHTWSLGVEEQFYILWPALLSTSFVLFRSRMGAILVLVAALTLSSFVVSIWCIGLDPSAAFYLPFPRAWELGVGGLLALARWTPGTRALAEACSIIGLVLLLLAFLVIKEGPSFPGWWAVLPVFGSALVIYGGTGRKCSIANLLSLPPVRYVGQISYSLYLWHWPLLVFYRHFSYGWMPRLIEAALLILVALLLSAVSYQFIEIPVRRSSWGASRTFGQAALGATLTVALCLGVTRSLGVPGRVPAEMRAVTDLAIMWDWPCRELTLDEVGWKGCTFGANWVEAKRRTLVWGDSNADHLSPLLSQIVPRDTSVLVLSPCPTFVGDTIHTDVPKLDGICRTTRYGIIDLLRNDHSIDTVVLSSAWTRRMLHSFVDAPPPDLEQGSKLLYVGLLETLRAIVAPYRRVVIVADIPEFSSDTPVLCATHSRMIWRKGCNGGDAGLTTVEYLEQRRFTNRALAKAASQLPGTTIIFPGEAMCPSGGICLTQLEGEFLYRDASHFRRNLSPGTNLALARLIGLERIWSSRSN
jgi:peptidoglycan/LPS O-acetylase OafA/YrhL